MSNGTEYYVAPRQPGVRPQDPPDYDGITFVYVFTNVLDPWVQPESQANVTLIVANAQGFVPGMTIMIEGGGYYEVVSTAAINQLTVMNFGTNYNQPPGTSIAPGKITTTSLPGPPGGTGPQGPAGLQGSPGAPLNPKGTVASSASLPASGNTAGDFFQALDTGHGWSWSGNAWIDLGPFRGPAGAAGAAGPAGPQGIQGGAGPTGAQGPGGPPGPAGTSVATTTTASFTQPAVNANVSVTLNSGAGISTGLVLYIGGGGYYAVVSIAGNVATLQNLGYNVNASPGTVINSGANVGGTGPMGPVGPAGAAGTPGSQGPTGATGPAGAPGSAGATGSQGPAGLNAFSRTSANFTVPNVGSTVNVTLLDASWIVTGQMLWIDQAGGPGVGAPMRVTAKTGNQVTLRNG
jgi:collagen triple helix repeat protein